MANRKITRDEAQQAFETLCKYLWQHKQPDEPIRLFIQEDLDFTNFRRLITMHDADRKFKMRYYIDGNAD